MPDTCQPPYSMVFSAKKIYVADILDFGDKSQKKTFTTLYFWAKPEANNYHQLITIDI